MVKNLNTILLMLLLPGLLSAQELTRLDLQQAYDLAKKNYPMVKQKDLIKRTAEISIDNLQKGFLPQINLNGQASYQSEVTEVLVKVPGFTSEPLSKDQYKLVADLNQLVYDGGTTKEQKGCRN